MEIVFTVIGMAAVLELLGEEVNGLIVKSRRGARLVPFFLKVQKVLLVPQVLLARILGAEVSQNYQYKGYKVFTAFVRKNANIAQRVVCFFLMTFWLVVSMVVLVGSRGSWLVSLLVVLINGIQSRGLKSMPSGYFVSFLGLVFYSFVVWLVSVSPFVLMEKVLEELKTLRDLLLESSWKAVLISACLIGVIEVYNRAMRRYK